MPPRHKAIKKAKIESSNPNWCIRDGANASKFSAILGKDGSQKF